MYRLSLVLGLLLFTSVAAAQAQSQHCEDLVFRLTQDGNHEQSFSGGETIVLKPGRDGHLRMYLRSKGPIPHTLSAEYGHPSEFGFRGMDPNLVRQVIQVRPQKPNNIERARVVFTSGQRGSATLGYRITGANDPEAFKRIPRYCRSGVLTFQVARDGRPTDPEPSGVLNVTGTWSTDYGPLILQQDGETVQGHFDEKRGHLIGRLDGTVLRGTWVQLPSFRAPNDAGDFELVFRPRDGRFNGAWRRGCEQHWEGQWNGWRMERPTTIIRR